MSRGYNGSDVRLRSEDQGDRRSICMLSKAMHEVEEQGGMKEDVTNWIRPQGTEQCKKIRIQTCHELWIMRHRLTSLQVTMH